MTERRLLALFLFALSLALLTSLVAAQETTLTPEPSSDPTIAPTPTIDRLAPPPTVENPTQADEGAHVYWLNCQPCHGDVGQGLTDEWRAQYPPDDQNCWNSGCHGKLPYESGFTLPTVVPPLIGEGSLLRFTTMAQVYEFMRQSMPYQAPASLSDDEYLAIAAFLARAHNVWDGTPLTLANIADVHLQPSAGRNAEAEPAEISTANPQEARPPAVTTTFLGIWGWAGIFFLIVLVAAVGGAWLWRRRRR